MKSEVTLLHEAGQKLIGKVAQSGLITEIGLKGQKVISPAAKITGYEIVFNFGEPELMVTIDEHSVYESTIFNVN